MNLRTTNREQITDKLPGYKVFSLVLWKQAVELLEQQPKLSAFALEGILSCTEKTAEGIVTDYRKLKKRPQTTVRRPRKKKKPLNPLKGI